MTEKEFHMVVTYNENTNSIESFDTLGELSLADLLILTKAMREYINRISEIVSPYYNEE